jgi:hypothetical protein
MAIRFPEYTIEIGVLPGKIGEGTMAEEDQIVFREMSFITSV